MKHLTIACLILLVGYTAAANAQWKSVHYSWRYIAEGCLSTRAHADYGDEFMREYPVPGNYVAADHSEQMLTERDAGVIRTVRFFK